MTDVEGLTARMCSQIPWDSFHSHDATHCDVCCSQVFTCYHPEDGGFGASPRNDSHLLSTLSALQILALLDQLHRVDVDKVAACESNSSQNVAAAT